MANRIIINGKTYTVDGSHTSISVSGNSVVINGKTDEDPLRNTLKWQRSSLLGVLSARKKGPIPLEQQRAALLFSLQQRAIQLIEDRDLV